MAYDLAIPLGDSHQRAVDGKDGRQPEAVESDAMVQGGHRVCQPTASLGSLVGVVGDRSGRWVCGATATLGWRHIDSLTSKVQNKFGTIMSCVIVTLLYVFMLSS